MGTKRPLSKAHVPDILDTANSRMSICLYVYMSICLYVYMSICVNFKLGK